MPHDRSASRSHRPKPLTVFAAAFVAGAAAAVGINRAVDIHLAQAKPQVECEPIFVALRTLPQGSPVTIWDVALRDWPKAMMPTTALRADDRFEGMILKHPVREGQPILSVQLAQAEQPRLEREATAQVAEAYVPAVIKPAPPQPDADLWAPSAAPVAGVGPAITAPTETVAMKPIQPESPAIEQHVEPIAQPTVDPTVDEVAAETTTDVAAVAAQPTALGAPSTEPAPTANVLNTLPELGDAASTDVSPEPTQTAAAAEASPVEPAATPVAAVGTKRYLVVPERIAIQAERSFTAPAPEQPQSTATPPAAQRQAPTAQDQASTAPARAATTQPRPAASNARAPASARKSPASQPQPRPARKPVPRVAEAPTNRTHPPQVEPPRPASGLGSMFPNLRAGIDALGGGASTPSTTASGPKAAPGTAGKPASRTAMWPWSAPRPTAPSQRSF